MNDSFLDAIAVVSFLIGLQNLQLNQEQVDSLDKHLAEQDKILREERDGILAEILKLLKEIKHALENDRRGDARPT